MIGNDIKTIWTNTECDARFMRVEFASGDIMEMNMSHMPELYAIDLMSDEGQQELREIISDVREGTYV